jgi:hypothetical protein
MFLSVLFAATYALLSAGASVCSGCHALPSTNVGGCVCVYLIEDWVGADGLCYDDGEKCQGQIGCNAAGLSFVFVNSNSVSVTFTDGVAAGTFPANSTRVVTLPTGDPTTAAACGSSSVIARGGGGMKMTIVCIGCN